MILKKSSERWLKKQHQFVKKLKMTFRIYLRMFNCFRKNKTYNTWEYKKATLNVNQLITKIRNFQHQTTLPLTLQNFIELNHIQLESIYKKIVGQGFERAGVIENFENVNENKFILQYIINGFQLIL
jgi:predicted ATP-grasp superfamily ATP-dependent carboligase